MHVHKGDILISCYGYIGVVAADGAICQLERANHCMNEIRSLESNWHGACMTSNYLLRLSEHATHIRPCALLHPLKSPQRC